jgi:hypothetical protein
MRRIMRWAAVLALVAPLVVLSAPHAHAASATTGDAVFSGTASLSTFPCQQPPPFGNGPCSGSFHGSWSGTLSGVAGTSPFQVAWSTSSPFSVQASFSYYELQCLDGTETALGVAQGSGTASAGPGEVQGKLQNVGDTFPRDVTRVDVTYAFTWTRVGNAAAMSFTPLTVVLAVSGIGSVTVVNSAQNGAAVFAPLQSTGTGVPTCSNQWTNVTGDIAGNIPIAG